MIKTQDNASSQRVWKYIPDHKSYLTDWQNWDRKSLALYCLKLSKPRLVPLLCVELYPPKRYVQILPSGSPTLGICDYDHIWKYSLCRCNHVRLDCDRPKSNDRCHYKRDMWRHTHKDKQGRRPGNDIGRDWSDAAMSQGILIWRIDSTHQMLGRNRERVFPRTFRGEHSPANILISES